MARTDQLRDLNLHHLPGDGLDRLADHISVLIEQHLLDDLLDRHPVGTGHRRRSFRRRCGKPDDHERRGGRNRLRGFRPTRYYTNPRDVTVAGPRYYGGAVSLLPSPGGSDGASRSRYQIVEKRHRRRLNRGGRSIGLKSRSWLRPPAEAPHARDDAHDLQ